MPDYKTANRLRGFFLKPIKQACELALQTLAEGGLGLGFVFLLGILLRLYFIPQPMRGDEAYTFLTYVNGDNWRDLFSYDVPNNHVLNTLLIRLSVMLFGAHPITIRIPAFLAGILGILLAWKLARVLQPDSRWSGLLAAAGMAVHPYLLLYATNARGYTLMVLLTLGMALLGVRFIRQTVLQPILLGLLAALNLYAMPSAALAVGGVFTWLGLVQLKNGFRRTLLGFVLPVLISTILFSAILYAPVVWVNGGIQPIIANKFVQPQTWPQFLGSFLPQLGLSFAELSRDIPWGMIALLGLLTMLGLARQPLLGLGLLLGAGAVLLIQHTNPYPRSWIYLLPFALVLADVGLSVALSLLKFPKSGIKEKRSFSFMPDFGFYSFMIVLTGFYAGWLALNNTITRYPDTSAFPEAPIAVKYLRGNLREGDAIRILNTADWSVYFYFWYEGIPYPQTREKDAQRVFYVVKKSRYSVSDMTNNPVTLVLEEGDLALYLGDKEK